MTKDEVVVVQTYNDMCADAELLASEGLLLDEWAHVKERGFAVSLPSWSNSKEALRFAPPFGPSLPSGINTGDLVLADVPPMPSASEASFPVTHKGMYTFVRLSGRWDEEEQFVLLQHPLTAPMPDVAVDGAVDLAEVTCHPDTVRSPATPPPPSPSGVLITLTPLRGYGEMRMQWVKVTTPPTWPTPYTPPNRRDPRKPPVAAGPKSVTGLLRQSHHHLDMKHRSDITTPLRACLLDARNERGPSAAVAMLLGTGVAAAIGGDDAVRLVIAMLYPAAHVHIVFHNDANLPMSEWDLVNAGSRIAKADVLFARAKSVQAWFPRGATMLGLPGSGLPLPEGAPPHSWQDAPTDAEFTTTTVPHLQYMVKVDLLRDRPPPPKPGRFTADAWKCDHTQCDFVGSFDEVVEHEKTCGRVNAEQEDGSLPPQGQQLLLPPPIDRYEVQGGRAFRAAESALKRTAAAPGAGGGGTKKTRRKKRHRFTSTPASAGRLGLA